MLGKNWGRPSVSFFFVCSKFQPTLLYPWSQVRHISLQRTARQPFQIAQPRLNTSILHCKIVLVVFARSVDCVVAGRLRCCVLGRTLQPAALRPTSVNCPGCCDGRSAQFAQLIPGPVPAVTLPCPLSSSARLSNAASDTIIVTHHWRKEKH